MTEVEQTWNHHKIHAVIKEGKCQIKVKDVLEALGYNEKKAQYNLKKGLRRHLERHRFKSSRGSPAHVLEPELMVKLLFPEVRRHLCPGEIYCFSMKHKENYYKFGRTLNWEERKMGYRGLNEIGKVLMVLPVQNIRSAERKLLRFARRTMISRIGQEYFESPVELEWVEANIQQFLNEVNLCDGTELETLERFLLNYKKISQLSQFEHKVTDQEINQ